MKIIPQTHFPKFSLPLPIYESIHIADAIGKDGEEFSVFIGLEKKYAEQLRILSLDERDIVLERNTNDRKRFGQGRYEEWYDKNRTPFPLIHKRSDALAALVWFGPKPLLYQNEMNWQTAGWRSYGHFRGKGIMGNFTRFAMDIYRQKVPEGKFWVILKRDNKGSARLAMNLGFEVLEEVSDEVSIVMIK